MIEPVEPLVVVGQGTTADPNNAMTSALRSKHIWRAALTSKYILMASGTISCVVLILLGLVAYQSNLQKTAAIIPLLGSQSIIPKIKTPAKPVPTVAPTTQPAQAQAPKSAPSHTSVTTQAPPASLPAVAGKSTSYSMGVLVVKYFPLTANGQNINIAVTGDVGDSYSSIRQKTTDITNNLLVDLPKATEYLGYKYPGDQPSLTYHVVNTKEYTQAVPIKARPGYPRYPDYNGMMAKENICNYVNNQGVREVWLWAYQGPNKSDGQPYLGINESKMSGPHGDISNSDQLNDMPICKYSYVVYTFNYGRGTQEAMHSWGHQLEFELGAVDSNLFSLFQGPAHPQTSGQVGRCGWVHNPPNARADYDYANSAPQQSDCEDWTPDGLGALTSISCATWGCNDNSENDTAEINYFVWMWQNLPGMNNTKTYKGKQLRNWWDVHGNFDAVITGSKHLTL